MQMTQKILEAEGEGDAVQLDFFLKGNLALEKDPRRKPHSWLPDQVSFALLPIQPMACCIGPAVEDQLFLAQLANLHA